MRVTLFCHSLLSDWNHGNAHFLRGVVGELIARGHQVTVYEPANGWSVENLVREAGVRMLLAARSVYPWLAPVRYQLETLNPERAVAGSDLVLVHEWTDPGLVRQIGAIRKRTDTFVALFHDTHHRAVTDSQSMQAYDLSGFDGVLAFGQALAQRYSARSDVKQVWSWHEAADVRVFYPRPRPTNEEGDVVFVGNWGDDERTRELFEFLVEPVSQLGLSGSVYGVRYPTHAIVALERAGLTYRGWAPNFAVPDIFARHRVTIHVPRRPYAVALPGIPTIRPFEALACGIPLISAPWDDTEGLFRAGHDYLLARDGSEIAHHLRAVLHDRALATQLTAQGRETILARHTCAHRVDALLSILDALTVQSPGFDASTEERTRP